MNTFSAASLKSASPQLRVMIMKGYGAITPETSRAQGIVATPDLLGAAMREAVGARPAAAAAGASGRERVLLGLVASGVTLTRAAAAAGVSVGTAYQWSTRMGRVPQTPAPRSDRYLDREERYEIARLGGEGPLPPGTPTGDLLGRPVLGLGCARYREPTGPRWATRSGHPRASVTPLQPPTRLARPPPGRSRSP
jgi:hypothetical protein